MKLYLELDGIVQDIQRSHATLLVYNLITVIVSFEDLEREGYTVQSKVVAGADDDEDDDEFALDNLGAKLVRII